MTYRRPVTLKHSPSWSSQTTEFSPASSNDHLEKQDDNESDQSHTYFSHSQQPIVAVGRNGSFKLKHQPSFSTPFATIPEQPYHAQAYRNSGAFSAANYPTRVPSTIFRTLYPLVSLARTRVDCGFTMGQLFLLVLYAVLLGYASFYRSNPFTDPVRTGWVATSQLPLVIALGTKNNVIGAMLSVSYEKINYLHRFAGRAMFFAINVHALGYIYKWLLSGTFSETAMRPSVIYGWVALVAVDMLALFSTSYMRRRFYGMFIFTHIVGVLALFVGCYLHKPSMIPYTLAAIALYSLDRLIRLFKTRLATATLAPVQGLNTTRISIPSIQGGWRAGQHVRVKVLSGAMGVFGWAETHAFTIASVAEWEGLVLMCKNSGNWTGGLMGLAGRGCGETGKMEGKVRVLVEGPYGGPGNTTFSSFSAALFIAGGSGISFALSSVSSLLALENLGRSRVKAIDLVWIVQDASSLLSLLPELEKLAQDAAGCTTLLRVELFYTRASPDSSGGYVGTPGKLPTAMRKIEGYFHPSIFITPGKPSVSRIVERAVDRAVAMGNTKNEEGGGVNKGMVVGVCGPTRLADGVVRAVDGVQWERKVGVGGVEVFEECFSM
ncbi:ferric reductase like transmembrane component-domain-containing protein [Pterulicium gracile]|uniref:Ferric reductase like transmembrane component-domain-containing protein n=1 Tax=Pterulicium gracile TaxID=1884261 RepID=A0A5C3Q2P2_9AGAR|nr:ferric reductase like transmembrane component-domain-containing protein [Pterula gracilis]